MSRFKRWEQHEYDLLELLIKEGLDNYEIAEILGRPRDAIAIKAHRFGGNPNYLRRKTKTKHLRADVLRFFQNHTLEETRKRFGLTPSELKSVFTIAYRMPELRHIRKDKRRRDAWSGEELRFMLMNVGLIPRETIAKKLNRGSFHAVKDKLDALNIGAQNLNGLTISKFRILFGREPDFFLQTVAGPKRAGLSGGHRKPPSFYKLVPWTWIRDEVAAGRLEAPEAYRKMIEAMATFQDWVFQGDALAKMQTIVKRAAREEKAAEATT